jgi:hypothetical protein
MDLASPNATGGLQQTDNGLTGEGFTGTRFAHNSKDLAGHDTKRYIVYSHQDSASGIKFDAKVFDVE